MSPDTLVTLAGPISTEAGPGLFLRVVVVASFVGVGLLAWVLLRAGRKS
ncbi:MULTISPECIES: hypothetical protein [Streptomycetaceae]|uniref:Uncharacterized protein n=1 Tax=Kitasatospora herbaricolor TaxID=68217 RepID=A0ABZ1WDN1_9ACTN|nr:MULTISPECIES: hypothetical protein [Streptomycetaceae]MCX5212959.1 hypothetical protein [Kitasatospora sp. NBC_00240]MDQ0308279.1 hypothetical protein [Kitasatospora herbaricolor]GGV06457.1 hypothetical protein GCM10010495_18320 [Kitasatospora herbaricolor]